MCAAVPSPPQLIETYYGRVLGLAYQVLGDAALATRAAETTFERLLDGGNRDRLAVWRISLAVLRSYLARGFTVTPLASDAAGWQGSLMDGLAQLAPAERIVLILRYHEGLTPPELAEVLGVDEARVRNEVAQARGRLMEVLGLRDALQ